ncbi:MAG TPA: succinate--CoA ligase subunit beta [Chroococcidiopsis sp.]
MDLLEYQAKELFQQMGIPVLPSQRIEQAKDLKGLKLPYPVVLKSQVYSGGRAKAGGIRFVENTIDAVAAAQAIFHLPIVGQYPEVLLAEAKYDPDQELYLAIMLDQSSRRPLLLGSQQGGIEVESAVQNMQQVIVDQEFSPFYARRLAIKMGLEGPLIQSVSSILEKMYWLFIHKDLDLVEINPLAVSPNGELMALDGKVTANDSALDRHADLAALRDRIPRPIASQGLTHTGLTPIELGGSIGLLCSGAGLTMTTLDLLYKAGGKPANFLNLGSEFRHDQSPSALHAQIVRSLDLFTPEKGVRVALINLIGNLVSYVDIVEVITSHLRRRAANNTPTPPLVVRLMGEQLHHAQEHLSSATVFVVGSLDEAIAKTIALSKVKPV